MNEPAAPRRRGRPALAAEDRRRQWHGVLAPATLAALRAEAERLGLSQAAVVDLAVARLAKAAARSAARAPQAPPAAG